MCIKGIARFQYSITTVKFVLLYPLTVIQLSQHV